MSFHIRNKSFFFLFVFTKSLRPYTRCLKHNALELVNWGIQGNDDFILSASLWYLFFFYWTACSHPSVLSLKLAFQLLIVLLIWFDTLCSSHSGILIRHNSKVISLKYSLLLELPWETVLFPRILRCDPVYLTVSLYILVMFLKCICAVKSYFILYRVTLCLSFSLCFLLNKRTNEGSPGGPGKSA